jgi:hypothetical protein
MSPWTLTCPREGSFALACFGKFKKVQPPETGLPFVAAGRWSFALKRIVFAAAFETRALVA